MGLQPNIERPKKFRLRQCVRCGQSFGEEGFAPTKSPFFPDGALTMCNDCIDNDLKKHLRKQKIQRSRLKPHSMPMTEQQIDMKLTEHFAQKPIITRREFQILCLQVKPTACRILRKLVEEGKLKNISTQQNPVYVPDNGHYAPVQGE